MVNLRGLEGIRYIQQEWRHAGTLSVGHDSRINLLGAGTRDRPFATKWDQTADIGVDWGVVEGDITLRSEKLTNLEGLPSKAHKVTIAVAPGIRDLSGLPTELDSLELERLGIRDLTTLPRFKRRLSTVTLRTRLASLEGIENLEAETLVMLPLDDIPLLRLVTWPGKVTFSNSQGPILDTTRCIERWQKVAREGKRSRAIMGAQGELVKMGLEGNARW